MEQKTDIFEDRQKFEDAVMSSWDIERSFLVLGDPFPDTMTQRLIDGMVAIMVDKLPRNDPRQNDLKGQVSRKKYDSMINWMESWYKNTYLKLRPNEPPTLYAKALDVLNQELSVQATR